MKKLVAVSVLVSLGSFVLTDIASAQIVVQPGTEFPAAPMSKGGISLLGPSQVLAPAPVGPVVAPAPAPAPVRRRKRRRG